MDKAVVFMLFVVVALLAVITLYNAAFERKRHGTTSWLFPTHTAGWLKAKTPVSERWATMDGYHAYCRDCPYRAAVSDGCGISNECEAPDGCSYDVPADYDYYKE